MRNFAAVIGVAIGGYVGWLFGSLADGYFAWLKQTQPAHTFTFIMAFALGSMFAYSLRRIVGDMRARHANAEAKVAPVEEKTQRRRSHTGRTPPSPFPAFQA